MTAFRRRVDYDPSYPDAAPWLYGIALNVLRAFHRSEIGRRRLSDRAGLVVAASSMVLSRTTETVRSRRRCGG